VARISAIAAGGVNVLAFLDTIAYSEIGPELMAATDDGYNVIVGSTVAKPILMTSYRQHPRLYEQLEDSTAAGRYQFIWPTWKGLLLPDFTPESQDHGAIMLMQDHGAVADVIAGRVAQAIIHCSKEWASFPSAGYGQHENTMNTLLTAYNAALSALQ
jgi:muramidase (phage lysozyme)